MHPTQGREPFHPAAVASLSPRTLVLDAEVAIFDQQLAPGSTGYVNLIQTPSPRRRC
jgi:hypothetical protein